MVSPSGTKRARYGTRQLIENVFQDAANSTGLKTSELVSKVQSGSGEGSKIPGPTIFQAARALVKKKILETSRDGREYKFKLAGKRGQESGPTLIDTTRVPMPASEAIQGSTVVPPYRSDEARPQGSLPVSSLPHRLDPGQMLVLKHDEKEIVTLTNLHGKPVVERHSL
jgi:hypothetical protein